MAVFAHGFGNACSEFIPLQSPLLVSDTPEYDARVVSVATDHASEKFCMLLVDSGKAVFLDDEYSEAVTYVKQSRSHRVVTRTVGVAAKLL